MKQAQLDSPILSSWFDLNGSRLDSKPYLSGALQAKASLAKLASEKESLANLTRGHFGGIYNGPQFVRHYVDSPEYGVPFLTSASMLLADLSNVGLLSKKDAFSPKLSYLRIEEGMTLISCSGTIGRMVYAAPYMSGMWSSQDILKVVPDPDKILPGYLYAYLSSKFGVPQVVGETYGSIITHIEPQHIAGLPVPRLGSDIEETVHNNIICAANLRSEYQLQIKEATAKLFSSVGLRDITAAEWHAMGRDLGFSHVITSPSSLRALNFNPRLEACLAKLSSVDHMSLGDICRGGDLQRSSRFKRVGCDPDFGVKFLGQKELFWIEPEGRYISPRHAPSDVFVKDETVLLAARGAPGEHHVYCRGEFITGPWLQYAYTEDNLRVRSGNPSISGAFLFAFLHSETAFRCLRSFSTGSIQQDIDRSMLARLPVPLPDATVRKEVEQLVRQAYQKRHKASQLEKEAVAIVERAIQEGAKS
jgi:hypothetical protein